MELHQGSWLRRTAWVHPSLGTGENTRALFAEMRECAEEGSQKARENRTQQMIPLHSRNSIGSQRLGCCVFLSCKMYLKEDSTSIANIKHPSVWAKLSTSVKWTKLYQQRSFSLLRKRETGFLWLGFSSLYWEAQVAAHARKCTPWLLNQMLLCSPPTSLVIPSLCPWQTPSSLGAS